MKTLRHRAFSPGAFAGIAAIVVLCFTFNGCNTDTTDKKIAVKSVTLNETEFDLVVGNTAQLTATVSPKNATSKKITWTSDEVTKATVDKDGKVTARAEGTATITATAKNGKKAACVVNVIEPFVVVVTGVRLNTTEIELAVGETATLTAEVLPTFAVNKRVTWTSSDETKATVSNEVATAGKVTAVAEGEANIIVTTEDGGKVATCKVTVTMPVAVTGVTLAPTELALVVGQTGTLTAALVPPNATNKKVTLTSSAETKATVDEDGIVTALAEGTATITVKTEDGDFEAECEVTVTAAGANVNEVQGKAVYLEDYKTVFNNTGLTFEAFAWEGSWASSYKGSYTFDSTEKTVSLTVTEAEDDRLLVPHAYKYEITADGSLLAQEIFTNNGTNELRGKTYSLSPLVGSGGDTVYTFTATGNTYSLTDSTRGAITGTYYYDSTDPNQKTVWFRPTSIGGKTIAGYYNEYIITGEYLADRYTAAADRKAARTNNFFATLELVYNPDTKKLQRKFGGI